MYDSYFHSTFSDVSIIFVPTTLPETNIFAPENGWLEYDRFLLGWPGLFSGAFAGSFRECNFFKIGKFRDLRDQARPQCVHHCQARRSPVSPLGVGIFCSHPIGFMYVDVSENRGTPKSSILIGFSIINHPFWGTPIFGNTHVGIRIVDVYGIMYHKYTYQSHGSVMGIERGRRSWNLLNT